MTVRKIWVLEWRLTKRHAWRIWYIGDRKIDLHHEKCIAEVEEPASEFRTVKYVPEK